MTVSDAIPTTVDLLRHGECEGGAIYRGATDSPLTPAGWRQMERALTEQAGWQRVITSPLQRCRRFAETLVEQHRLPLEVDGAWRELSFGAWEGRDTRTVWEEDPERVEAWYRNPGNIAPPGGESPAAASERLVAAWQQLLARHGGEHVLLVVHGGVIRLLLTHLLGAPLASSMLWHVPPATLARVRVYHSDDGDFPQLMMLRPGEEAPCSA